MSETLPADPRPEVLIPSAEAKTPVPVQLVTEEGLEAALAEAGAMARGLAEAGAFKGKVGQFVSIPGADGRPERVLFGMGQGAEANPMTLRALPAKLPVGDYALIGATDPARGALAFALGSYRFDRYKTERGKPRPRLVVEDGAALAEARRIEHACALARDMVNTPANDMGRCRSRPSPVRSPTPSAPRSR